MGLAPLADFFGSEGAGPALVGSVLMRKPIAKVVPLRIQLGSP